MISIRVCLIGLVLLFAGMSYAQDSTGMTVQRTGVELTAQVNPNPVPQNRMAELTVRVRWYGDLDRYEMHSFENPIVENFEIKGSGSANRIVVQDVKVAIREYTFNLAPQAMGMAYIEGMILTYTDLKADKDFTLTTNRIPVEIVSPIKESSGWPWYIWTVLGFGLVGGGVGWMFYRRKTTNPEQTAEETDLSLEDVFRQELETETNLNDPNLNVNVAYEYLSRLLRRFMSQKYKLPGLEATTREFIEAMKTKRFSDSFLDSIRSILERADAVKFSGERVERQELDQCYLRIDNIIQKCSQNEDSSFFNPTEKSNTNE